MTDWKPIPGAALASDVRHLVVELRALKDRTGLSLAALAGRTPYSKSSWERYFNGKALPPQHAVAALGKLVDADPARLSALWELANAAWHEPGARDVGDADDVDDARDGRPTGPDPETERPPAAAAGERPGGGPPTGETAPGKGAEGEPAQKPPVGRRPGRQRLIWSAAGLAAVGAACAGLFGAYGDAGHSHADRAGATATDTETRQLDVNCFADSCTGKFPGGAGCGGDAWTAALSRVAGVYVELRYSDACKAAWARISWGRPGDIARVVGAGGRTYQNKVHYDTDVFSAMVSAPSPSTARACVQLTAGVHACTDPGGTLHLNQAPNPPSPTATAPPSTPSQGRSGSA
ncbi:DUF2690 domain-containing protein [Streptomyces sp. NPDC057963]|uniref:helix-turn-helix domain-containing protein n=1 Tax=Streptomyces sp. NPDC057963 TaxID=3346290 RepID=UPI0036E703AC